MSDKHLRLFIYFYLIQCFSLAESTKNPDVFYDDLTIKHLIEENRSLKNVIEKLEEKFDRYISQTSIRSSTAHGARTCHELMRSGPTLESGMYYVDPDGWNAGDSPIYVYCDKATGETKVLHDSQDKTDVGHCYDPGCYSRPVNYNASMRQMRALIELSPVCEQYIRYDCLTAVFEFNGVQYCWWSDRNGEPRYYWAGNNDTVHTCSCGIAGNCIETNVLCNCDASAPVPLYDEGCINHKDHLPITHLSFGRTSTYAHGEHTLGPLTCSGSFQTANSMPSSCADLWRAGETQNGFYQVRASDGKMITVYCDMSKLPEETGHQTLIGFSDVKSTLVYFTAVREVDNYATIGTIPYDRALLNVGNAMNIQTGKFTAPKRGIYFFSFTICSTVSSFAYIYRNGVRLVVAVVTGASWNSASAQATIELNAGDVVYTYLGHGKLNSNEEHHNHFTGYLLQEL